jgi:hypothetical protein
LQYAYSAFANVMDFFGEEIYEFVHEEVSGLFDADVTELLNNASVRDMYSHLVIHRGPLCA